MTGASVLVIEDDQHVRSFLDTSLSAQGFNVSQAGNGGQAIKALASSVPDLVLLDLGLPDTDGVELIRQLRAFTKVPVIVLSARTQEAEKIAALDAGADDYLTKPFGIGELQARIRAAMRRLGFSEASKRDVYRVGEVTLDVALHSCTLRGEPLKLTPIEFRLLEELMKADGRVVTQNQLLTQVWGEAHTEDSHYLRIYMRQLRIKIEDVPAQPRYILTEPGVGYRLGGQD